MKNITAKLIITVLAFLFVLIHPVNAYTPWSPGPEFNWFHYQLFVDSNTLPEGIEINQIDDRIILSNRNIDFFYLIRDWNIYNEPNAYESEVPKGYQPLKKINKYEVYEWRLGLEHQTPGGWILYNRLGYTPPKVEVFSFDLNFNNKEDYQIIGYDRPADVVLPKPRNFNFIGFYKGKIVRITGQQVFSLNKNYNPDPESKSAFRNWEGKKDKNINNKNINNNNSVMFVIFSVFVFLILYLIYKLLKKQ